MQQEIQGVLHNRDGEPRQAPQCCKRAEERTTLWHESQGACRNELSQGNCYNAAEELREVSEHRELRDVPQQADGADGCKRKNKEDQARRHNAAGEPRGAPQCSGRAEGHD